MTARREPDDDEADVAEPEPDTIGVVSGTAKCHHCGQRIIKDGYDDGWVHVATELERCDP